MANFTCFRCGKPFIAFFETKENSEPKEITCPFCYSPRIGIDMIWESDIKKLQEINKI